MHWGGRVSAARQSQYLKRHFSRPLKLQTRSVGQSLPSTFEPTTLRGTPWPTQKRWNDSARARIFSPSRVRPNAIPILGTVLFESGQVLSTKCNRGGAHGNLNPVKQAVILAGGKGTRLRSVLGDLPKPLIPIGGRPLLEHQFELCRRHGFNRVLVLAGHRAERIEAHCGDGSRWGLQIECEIEREPLGTAGAVLAAFSRLPERFLVLYGDEMLNVDLDRIWRAHIAAGCGGHPVAPPTITPLIPDLVDVDDQDWIRAFHHRPHPPELCFRTW